MVEQRDRHGDAGDGRSGGWAGEGGAEAEADCAISLADRRDSDGVWTGRLVIMLLLMLTLVPTLVGRLMLCN